MSGSKALKFVFLSEEEYSLPVAKHLVQEGCEVWMGIIEDSQSPDLAVHYDETPEERKRRLSNYDGLLEKSTHEEILKKLKSVAKEDQDDYFIFFDYNDTYPLAEKVLDMGFRQGLFPTEFYFDLEKDRDQAKEFVKKHYKRIRVAEDHEFFTSEEGIEFLNETQDIFVLKSNGSFGRTVVPKTQDPEFARVILTDALTHYREDYEKGGFLLEKKIQNAIEVTPIKVYYDGKPLFTIAEFENKEFGSGNIGIQKGGNQVLTMQTPMDCPLNRMAFPPIIDELASDHPGLALYDAGLLYDGSDFWFSEFAGMRFGYDGIFALMAMRSDGKTFVSEFFGDLIRGESPIKSRFGASVRLFNLEGSQVETKMPKDDLPMAWDRSIDPNLFLYRAKRQDGQIVSVGEYDPIGCVTGHGDDLRSAVDETYDRISKFSFEKLYYRPKFDFLSKDYRTSILNRLNAILPFMRSERRLLKSMEAVR